MEFQYINIEYGQLLLESDYGKKLKPGPEEQTPYHSSFSGAIISGSGSFSVQFGDHFLSGDHLRRCTDRAKIVMQAILYYFFLP